MTTDGDVIGEVPVINRMHKDQVALIRATVAAKASDAEVGLFLQLAHHYDLDPFAKEIWCVKSDGKNGREGRLLIMVGRDGLRKIAQRNGLHMDGDVVRENDSFKVIRSPDGNRTVEHQYGMPKERGAIVGAWSEVREGGPLGRPMGFFYAPIEEYDPVGMAGYEYKPWSRQKGVMILAAAERQAARQATPLAGLLVDGEQDVIEGTLSQRQITTPKEWPQELQVALDRVRTLDPDAWPDAKVEMMGTDDRNAEYLAGVIDQEADVLSNQRDARREAMQRRLAELSAMLNSADANSEAGNRAAMEHDRISAEIEAL